MWDVRIPKTNNKEYFRLIQGKKKGNSSLILEASPSCYRPALWLPFLLSHCLDSHSEMNCMTPAEE